VPFLEIGHGVEKDLSSIVLILVDKDLAGEVDGQRGGGEHQRRAAFRVAENQDFRRRHLEPGLLRRVAMIEVGEDGKALDFEGIFQSSCRFGYAIRRAPMKKTCGQYVIHHDSSSGKRAPAASNLFCLLLEIQKRQRCYSLLGHQRVQATALNTAPLPNKLNLS